jgi:hypothetical protein
MPNLKASIQELLHLQAGLPRSLTRQIRVNDAGLIELHDQFVDMASEFRLWSFYETQESMLSGSAAGLPSEVQFGAPLVSVKSALLDLWQEDVYAVESDHAHLASFMPNNAGILDSYLSDLAGAISKAARLNLNHPHTPLNLRSRVKVEVIGFYEDPDAGVGSPRQSPGTDTASIIRLYSTKYAYKDFLKTGPERCLAERLHRGLKRRPSQRGAAGNPDEEPSARAARREDTGLSLPTSSSDASQSSTSPEIVVTRPQERPPLLRVPAQSEPSFRPPSPESAASISTTVSDSVVPFSSDFAGDEAHTIGLLAHQQAKILMKEHELTTTAGFSRPNPSLRKFMWVHMPFNNPVWVKVRDPLPRSRLRVLILLGQEIFATFARTQGKDFSRLFDYDNWASKQIQNRNSDSQPAYLKTMCKYLSAADRLASPRIPSPFGPPTRGIIPNCLYLYLPYLHFDTYRSMIQRRKLIAKRRRHGRAKPVPQWVDAQESLELKVIWEYIGYDPPLNCRRTLDQFGHHSLRDTNSRDDDQMLYKLTKKDAPMLGSHGSNTSFARSERFSVSTKGSASTIYGGPDTEFGIEPGSELKNGYVLMVDQLWLWSIDMSMLPVCPGALREMLTLRI